MDVKLEQLPSVADKAYSRDLMQLVRKVGFWVLGFGFRVSLPVCHLVLGFR